MNIKYIFISIVVLGITVFAWWTISPLFINVVVEDELSSEVQALLTQETNAPTADTPPLADSPVTENTKSVPAEVGVPSAVQNESTLSDTPVITGPFAIEDTPGHTASGRVRVIE